MGATPAPPVPGVVSCFAVAGVVGRLATASPRVAGRLVRRPTVSPPIATPRCVACVPPAARPAGFRGASGAPSLVSPPPRPGAPPRPSHRPQRCCGSAARLSHARVLARCAPPAQARSVVAARAIAKQPSALTDDMCFFCHTARFLGVLQCTCVFCCLVRCRLAFGSV